MDIIKYNHRQPQQGNMQQASIPSDVSHNNQYNLFVLQNQYENIAPISQKGKSKSFRRITIKKTPSEIIKLSILKNRKSKRTEELKSITKDNIKLFIRLQSQRSQYNLSKLHKDLSCSILPLAKSKITNQTANSKVDTMSIQRLSRCSSAAPSLKFRCKSLRHNLKSSNSTSRTLNIISSKHEESEILEYKATSKMGFIEKDKQNIIVNKQMATLNNQQQQILMKKIGMKIPIGQEKKANRLNQKIGSLHFTIKKRMNAPIKQQRVVLGQRKIDMNTQG